MKPHPLRLVLDSYPHRFEVQTRFADVDPQWHLNNVRVAEFYQEGRISFNRALSEEFHLERQPGHRILVARQSMDYLAELEWPGAITIAVGVSRIGGASFSLALALFQRGRCAGVSDATLVYATQTGPTRVPDKMREVLSSKLLPEAARL